MLSILNPPTVRCPTHTAKGRGILEFAGKVITYTRAYLAEPEGDYSDYFNAAGVSFFNYR